MNDTSNAKFVNTIFTLYDDDDKKYILDIIQ